MRVLVLWYCCDNQGWLFGWSLVVITADRQLRHCPLHCIVVIRSLRTSVSSVLMTIELTILLCHGGSPIVVSVP